MPWMKDLAQRIAYPLETITFDQLPSLLEAFAYHLPFENTTVLEKRMRPFTDARFIETFLTERRGGVCYDLNGLLHRVLLELNCPVRLVQATVYDQKSEAWSATGPTHVAIIWNETHLLDTGFGVNLPLVPVPLNGETVHSASGSYRISKGDVLEMLRTGQADFATGYRFDRETAITTDDLSKMEQIIQQSDASPFNKGRLVAMRTPSGQKTLTERTLRIEDTTTTELPVAGPAQFEMLYNTHFLGQE
ncbi:arylamine N-acetyltransferase family protein [Exiguobacterium acetylicum]|uniref:arylamine N-acetyltransferase family protein n=1 Tax=Exiguobacterium acetylicum TaxID=41170 RepID=UPI001EE2739D|nr:arylamine N-acetyltransferase [Exiguobacterium acetylicum]UKS57516.1 arylamine N-acetyltransferase [Exiguobacterium acetylicum]